MQARVRNVALVSINQEITHKIMLNLFIIATRIKVVISEATFVNKAYCVETYIIFFSYNVNLVSND